ncbi:MAG: preprotein translocase subunit SecY [Gemmatimonadetes bacterium]|nr:preprotein translocase subunit SecY [Gemmatimonadota bacterium]MEC8990542.1 preprotein translocase subunit SecY [Candidatus Latescibacterota bacterium]MEE3040495.1 preprotein translocase subunit SecY [Candidatus Latescibacterota bacterium]MEE3264861.1 preprotein translocase subunit SecY [Candidatus Latescibacterota bacterium]HCV23826.1 preprotein translocase subunit SecY [Candidatus Latescibacterota bacterium]
MLQSIQNCFKIPDLRRKILYTIGILIVYRIGGQITVPGIRSIILQEWFASAGSTIFGLYDMFVGGAFTRATVFALGIMPYISASIILQLMGAVVPFFQKLQREGEEGRKKINQYTRYGTVFLAAAQSLGVSYFLESIRGQTSGIEAVIDPGWGFRLLTMVTITTGTIFIMWLGEQITERGIGNGISLIIFIGIIAELPFAVKSEWNHYLINRGFSKSLIEEIFLLALIVIVVAFVVLLTQGQRRIPVQYAKRVVGRRVYGGQSTHIPLRINAAGVIPIIFAQSIMFLPGTLTQFWPQSELMQSMGTYFSTNSLFYWFFYGMMIIFFTYFYTAIVMDPNQLSDNMKRHGGFIPGVRPGKRTAAYIDSILTRITLPGSFALAAVAVFPFFVIEQFNVTPSYSQFFGGTGLLIIVGVALDTLQQIESQLMTRHYEGFMKKGRIQGRR